MLISLLLAFIITINSLSWGMVALKIAGFNNLPDFNNYLLEVLLVGLACITIVTGYFSLFLPVNTSFQILFLIFTTVPVVYFRKDLKSVFQKLFLTGKSTFVFVKFLMIFFLFLTFWQTLIPSTNNDTGHNHLPCISWMQDYAAVPGLANLFVVFGNSSSWFWAGVLFNFHSEWYSFHILNSVIFSWFLVYLIFGFQSLLRRNINFITLFKSALLVVIVYYFFIYWLHLASLSSDVPCLIIQWLIFVLFYKFLSNKSSNNQLLESVLIFLIVFATTLKLSNLPLLAVCFYVVYLRILDKDYQSIKRYMLMSIFILVPYFVRNIITTGYLIYPLSQLDLFTFDWKVPKVILDEEQKYIGLYARLGKEHYNLLTQYKNMDLPFTFWITKWWNSTVLVYKAFLILLPFSLGVFFFGKKPVAQLEFHNKGSFYVFYLSIIVCLVFWFMVSPNIRYGFGFITSMIISSFVFAILNFKKKFVPIIIYAFSAILIFFSIKSLYNISPAYTSIILPYNYKEIKPLFKKRYINGNKYYEPNDKFACYDKIPCFPDFRDYSKKIQKIEMRSDNLQDGFRIK